MTKEHWLACRAFEENARLLTKDALDIAEREPLPENLRPAEAKDIVEGRFVWYPDWDERQWAYVEHVRYPEGDDFKMFTAHDGCRYGLRGCFVEC